MPSHVENLDRLPESASIYSAENSKFLFLPADRNGRQIFIHKLQGAQIAGESLYYPDVTLYSNKDQCLYAPIREKTMSLQAVENSTQKNLDLTATAGHCDTPVFFFIYNTDNYYHFIYDSLPYLISYLHLKQHLGELKLLMSYPTSQTKNFYKFVLEFLDLLGITTTDILLAQDNLVYKEIYISSSYTHDIDSNLPPREEIHAFYQQIVANNRPRLAPPPCRKFYISRRTWLHNDFSNIGTNYTTRRKLENEDELVEFLLAEGFQEVFTENLSTLEKISLFAEAEVVVGALGGGVCNVLFSNPATQLICLVSPTFLEVNNRFRYSLERVDISYITDTHHIETGHFKKFMRVNCPVKNIVGEITAVHESTLEVAYTRKTVAGWNAQNQFEQITLNQSDCIPLDSGLNSAWSLDMDAFKNKFNRLTGNIKN